MTPDECAKLRELAEKATPGPWEAMEYDNNPGDEGCCILAPDSTVTGSSAMAYVIPYGSRSKESVEANAAYISAANPAVILALLDALDAAESRALAAEVAARGLQERADRLLEGLTAQKAIARSYQIAAERDRPIADAARAYVSADEQFDAAEESDEYDAIEAEAATQRLTRTYQDLTAAVRAERQPDA